MGINQIQRREVRLEAPQQEKRQAESPLDKLMTGLQVANGIFGIAVNYQTFEKLRNENQATADQKAGILTPMQRAGLTKEGFIFSDGNEGPQPPSAQKFTDSATGQPVYARVAPPPEKLATREVKKSGKVYQQGYSPSSGETKWEEEIGTVTADEPKPVYTAKDLQTQYDSDKDVALAKGRIHSFRTMQKLAADKTGASDLALAMNAIKANDPGSTVSGGELAQVGKTTNAEGWIVNLYNQVAQGVKLNDQQRNDLMNMAKSLASASMETITDTNSEYVRIAKESKVDPKYLRLFTSKALDEPSALVTEGGSVIKKKKKGGSSFSVIPEAQADRSIDDKINEVLGR